MDEKFVRNLVQRASEETNQVLSGEIEKYLKKRIENKGKEIPCFVDGKVSNACEYFIYGSILAMRIGDEEFYKTFQDFMITAGLINEEDKISGGYLN